MAATTKAYVQDATCVWPESKYVVARLQIKILVSFSVHIGALQDISNSASKLLPSWKRKHVFRNARYSGNMLICADHVQEYGLARWWML